MALNESQSTVLQCYSGNQGRKVDYILSIILIILVIDMNTDSMEDDSHAEFVFIHSHQLF